jgi:hypothetical protein
MQSYKDDVLSVYQELFPNLPKNYIQKVVDYLHTQTMQDENYPMFIENKDTIVPSIYFKPGMYKYDKSGPPVDLEHEYKVEHIIDFLNKTTTFHVIPNILSYWFDSYLSKRIYCVELDMLNFIHADNKRKNIVLYAGAWHIYLLKNFLRNFHKNNFVLEEEIGEYLFEDDNGVSSLGVPSHIFYRYKLKHLHSCIHKNFNESKKHINCSFNTHSRSLEYINRI